MFYLVVEARLMEPQMGSKLEIKYQNCLDFKFVLITLGTWVAGYTPILFFET